MINSVTLKCSCGKSVTFLKSSFDTWRKDRYSCGCKRSEYECYPVQKLIWLTDRINYILRYAVFSKLFEPVLLTTDYNPVDPRWLCISGFTFRPMNTDKLIHVVLIPLSIPEASEATIVLEDVSRPFEEISLVSVGEVRQIPELDPELWIALKTLKYWNWESLQIRHMSDFDVASCSFETNLDLNIEIL